MVRHQAAAFADDSPSDWMVWIAGDFYNFAVFKVQQGCLQKYDSFLW